VRLSGGGGKEGGKHSCATIPPGMIYDLCKTGVKLSWDQQLPNTCTQHAEHTV